MRSQLLQFCACARVADSRGSFALLCACARRLGILPLRSLPGLITGIFLIVIGVTNFVALFFRESYDKPAHVLAKKEKKEVAESAGALDSLVQTAIMLKEQNKGAPILHIRSFVLLLTLSAGPVRFAAAQSARSCSSGCTCWRTS